MRTLPLVPAILLMVVLGGCTTTDDEIPVCGDGICEPGEGQSGPYECTEDCSGSSAVCGNGICESDENQTTCPQDCKSTTELSISITTPSDGITALTTLTVEGLSTGAVSVSLFVNNEFNQIAQGLDEWNVVFEPGSLPAGTNIISATAVNDEGNEVTDSITVIVPALSVGLDTITYSSSVDGEVMDLFIYTPQAFDHNGPAIPLLIYLHGGGGTGVDIERKFGPDLDARGWIGIAPVGREWNLHNQGCEWMTSAAYVDSDDPDVGPGEQDILDAIDFAVENYPIDTDRIYLTGHSMGGRGAYIIGLKNPDKFAAIAVSAPASDMFEIHARRPEPSMCKEGMTGGKPGDNLVVDTMYTLTSGRFLLENAYNLPVFHGHGTNDGFAWNIPGSDIFLHGFHMVTDNSWNACHINEVNGDQYCFGHTPTLSELNTLHPAGYEFAYMFTDVKHATDNRWVSGTPIVSAVQGIVDSEHAGDYLGIMDFFERHTLVNSPETIVYKTYTDTHRRAYWAEIDISTPWLDTPGAIRATRDTGANRLDVELVRVSTATFDLGRAGLMFNSNTPLTVTVDQLNEPVFDPALGPDGEMLESTLIITADFTDISSVTVLRDGVRLSNDLVSLSPSAISIGPISIAGPSTLEITVSNN